MAPAEVEGSRRTRTPPARRASQGASWRAAMRHRGTSGAGCAPTTTARRRSRAVSPSGSRWARRRMCGRFVLHRAEGGAERQAVEPRGGLRHVHLLRRAPPAPRRTALGNEAVSMAPVYAVKAHLQAVQGCETINGHRHDIKLQRDRKRNLHGDIFSALADVVVVVRERRRAHRGSARARTTRGSHTAHGEALSHPDRPEKGGIMAKESARSSSYVTAAGNLPKATTMVGTW